MVRISVSETPYLLLFEFERNLGNVQAEQKLKIF